MEFLEYNMSHDMKLIFQVQGPISKVACLGLDGKMGGDILKSCETRSMSHV